MTAFFVIGGIGIALVLVSLVVGEHVHGIFDALGGGDWFTGASMAGFLGALGFGGAIVLGVSGSMTLAIIAGVLLGLLFGGLVAYLVIRLRNTQEGGAPSSSDLVDREGVVISDIPADGMGEIRIVQGGHITKLNARSAVPLKAGTQVSVTDVLSATSVRVVPTYR